MSGKLLGVLKQVAPQVSRITVIYYPQQVPQVGRLGAIQTAASVIGLRVSGAATPTKSCMSSRAWGLSRAEG